MEGISVAPAFESTNAASASLTSNATPPSIIFTGANGDFRRLVSVGALLELVTVGFYRFWLATNMRRHLWSSTVIGGDALEYLGTGKELLFGFLFAVALLAPIYLVYFLIGVEAERARAFASAPLGLFLIAFGQFAIYRARRYRLHRTVWRGLRFGMEGSGWSYAARALKWGILTTLSLGFALPWAQAALERYKLEHTFYGDLEGRFVGRGGDFFKRAWWLWVGAFILAALYTAALILIKDTKSAIGLIPMLVGGIAAPFVYAAYKAIQWKWWLEGLRIGDVRAHSSLKASSLFGNYWKLIGLAVLTLSLGGAVMGGIIGLGASLGHSAAAPPVPVIILLVVAYLATVLTIGAIWRIYFIQRIWKIVVSSLSLHNLEAAREVALRPDTSRPTALGEGFADSLDVVGF